MILATLILGIMIPDIEFVLGMVGSTIGSAVGIIFPSLMFIRLTTKNTTEKILAQLIFVVGVAMMVVGTYSNLHEANRSMESIMEEKNIHMEQVEKSLGVKTHAPDIGIAVENAVDKNAIATSPVAIPAPDLKKLAVAEDTERREPVVPHPPKDEDDVALGENQQKKTTSSEQQEKVTSKKPMTINNSEDVNPKEIVKKLEEGLEKKVKKVVQKEKELKVREQKADELLQELRKQKDEQKQLIEEQKEVLQQMKEHVNDEQAQAPNNEGKAAVVSQASPKQENKLDLLPSDNVVPARAKVPDKGELPKPSPRGPMISPDQYKNSDSAGQFARVEDSQVQQGRHHQGQPHNQTNMVIQHAGQDQQSVYQQRNNRRPVVEPGDIQQEPKNDLTRGEQGQQQRPQNDQGYLSNQGVGYQRHNPGNDFVEEERLYRIPNRGNPIIPENEAGQRKSNDPNVDDKSSADTIDGEVGVGRDLKSMVGEGRT